jgi:FkbM family methyltransferase
MSSFFDKALHHLGKTNKETFVMNIGAMDGVMFDEMIGYTTMYKLKGIYVEPIPYLFDKLKNNIPEGNLFENSAISDYNGTISMLTIDRDVIDKGLVHSCFYGMSAVYPPKNGLGSEFDKPTVEQYGKLVEVNCITFETLLIKHNIQNFDVVKIDAEGHDYKIFKQINLEKYRPKIVRLEWVNLSKEEQLEVKNQFEKNNYVYELSEQDVVGLPKEFHDELFQPKIHNSEKITFVTGLWNIGRENLNEGWSRSFEHYLNKFEQLLGVDVNLIIYGDSELETFVKKYRRDENTQFILRDISWFKNSEFYDKIQNIRTNPEWYNISGWLKDSTQAKLEMYNPLVMSKMFLLHDAKILDKFNSSHLFWIDAGLTNTVHPGYFTHDKIQNKLGKIFKKFGFVCFPYNADKEIHGFEFNKINEICDNTVNLVARGGFFGGPKEYVSQMNNIYYSLLVETLSQGYMGTEESIFSIMLYKNPDLINYYEIENNGLISKFFEDVKNDKTVSKNTNKNTLNNLNEENSALYVITFNSPKQFKTLITSMELYDPSFLTKPKKFLLDNSTDLTTTEEYRKICVLYGFEHIKKENLGICGGRQFIAEHADENNFDFYLFFEDDMFFYVGDEVTCRNGFNRKIDKLYDKILTITKNENLDFLKLNFSEFYGDNSVQWSWYNVPEKVREEYWPNNKKLPKHGLDPNAPKTEFKTIKTYKGVPYALGEIYYCNWPQVVTKDGNKKMFLETKWVRPFEQTWMSHIYQETKKGKINSGLLLMTPTEHNRFEFYDGSLRKES